MDYTSIIDYIKQTYPKVVFTPFKFQQSKALAFIISDNNLVIGFVNSNGSLCKLIEPVDLNILSSESMRSIIEHIPIVKGFTDEDKMHLMKMANLKPTFFIHSIKLDMLCMTLTQYLNNFLVLLN